MLSAYITSNREGGGKNDFLDRYYIAMSYCAPSSKGTGGTCYSRESLIKIAKAYNEVRAKTPGDKIEIRDDPDYLWDQIRRRLSGECKTEWCWLETDVVQRKLFGDKELMKLTFLPKAPTRSKGWLSNHDIQAVMDQYEASNPDFAFMGALPIDFAELMSEIAHIDLKKYYGKGKRMIGFIFNMDPSYMRGSHWSALIVNMRVDEPYIGYFDSYGKPPVKEIAELIRWMMQYKIRGKKFVYKYNKREHQFADGECGVYSLHFIIQSIKGKSFEAISENVKRDEEISMERLRLFREAGEGTGKSSAPPTRGFWH